MQFSDNTNKLNLELYAVIAEVDGAGCPLAYLLLTTTNAITNGARSNVLSRFLSELKNVNVNPRFVLTDKDAAQIKAIKVVWPNTNIQLCYWHLKRAVRKQLSSNKNPVQSRYNMLEAKNEFPYIDLEFYP